MQNIHYTYMTPHYQYIQIPTVLITPNDQFWWKFILVLLNCSSQNHLKTTSAQHLVQDFSISRCHINILWTLRASHPRWLKCWSSRTAKNRPPGRNGQSTVGSKVKEELAALTLRANMNRWSLKYSRKWKIKHLRFQDCRAKYYLLIACVLWQQ